MSYLPFNLTGLIELKLHPAEFIENSSKMKIRSQVSQLTNQFPVFFLAFTCCIQTLELMR